MQEPSGVQEIRESTEKKKIRWPGRIALRTAILSWTLIIGTVGIFVFSSIPYQKKTIEAGMSSEAKSIATSIDQVTATAIITEDYGAVVEHCMRVVKEGPSILYVVLTRNDGFSLISIPQGWRQDKLSGPWNPSSERVAKSLFIKSDLVNQDVFHYSYPFKYSGIDWGWIHLGLSLKQYHADIKSMYQRTIVLALLCILLGMVVSLIFARRLTNPIKVLDSVTGQVAKGDLTAKADVRTGDELERLANSFNKMTEALAKSQGDLLASKEALQKARDELEQHVKERTFELVITNEQLHRKTEDLIRSNKELEQFAYVASHDLQEPLRMVTSYVQLLAQRYKDKLDQDANEFIDFAVDGATRMYQLINDLLAYSRVSTRGNSFELVDCEEVFHKSVNNLKVAVEESGAEVTHDLLPKTVADFSQLEQLLQNLIGNAIKFHGEESPRVHISASPDGDHWVFSVRDNGIGIAPEYAERIFVIFQRLHGKDKYPGTGIGLAICKKIVERLGGRIWVESEPGKGATFYFTLPKEAIVSSLAPP